MVINKLRIDGDSLVLTIPTKYLDALDLKVGDYMGIELKGSYLIAYPVNFPAKNEVVRISDKEGESDEFQRPDEQS